MKRLVIVALGAMVLSSCTTIQPHYYSFSIRQIDPPLEMPANALQCVPVGYDGLACEDSGLNI